MAVTEEQQRFLEQLALRIPLLFEAIAAGNVKCEFIVGVRRIDHRHVQLKIIAEVVDPGANPLKTHGMHVSVTTQTGAAAGSDAEPVDMPLRPKPDRVDDTPHSDDNQKPADKG